jgi:O-antigen/teichoic acid export membrane protein
MRQQLRQLSGDTAIYGVTTIVQRFLTFLLTPFYTQFLLPAELGRQASIFAAIAFVMILANAGMEAAYFKFETTAESEEEKRSAFWSAISVNWLVAAVIGAVIILLPAAFNQVAFLKLSPQYYHLLRMAGLIIFFDSASMVMLAQLRVRRRPKVFSAIKLSAIVVNVGLNIWLVAVLHMKVEGVFLANVVQSVVQFLLLLPFLFGMFPVSIDRTMIGQLLRFGLPTVAAGLAAIALQVIDRPIMLNVLGDKGEDAVGLYQANYRLGIIMMMFVSVFEFAWRPFFLQQASKPNARQLYARVFTYFNLVAAVIFLAVSFFIVNIAATPIPFRHGTIIQQNYWSGLVIVPIVLAAYIFNGWYTNFIVGIYIEKKTRALPWVTGVGALAEALLCFTLIPLWGIAGGAWATLAAYLVMALTLYWYIQRYYRIDYEWGRVARIAFGVAAVWGANSFLDFYDRSLRAGLIRLGLLLAFIGWLFISRFFDPSERREIGRFLPFLRQKEPV